MITVVDVVVGTVLTLAAAALGVIAVGLGASSWLCLEGPVLAFEASKPEYWISLAALGLGALATLGFASAGGYLGYLGLERLGFVRQ